MNRAEISVWRERDKRSMAMMERILFPVFFSVALVGRLFPDNRLRARCKGESLVSEASDLTHSVVPWFFVFR